jgi:hypothetical protein
MQLASLADFTLADGNARKLSATSIKAKWFQVQLVSSTAGVRLGDASILAGSRGILIADGGAQFSPPAPAEPTLFYDLSSIYVIGTAGDVVAVNYAV